ncbi:HD-GYP domain-containing protein [Sporomusa sp.]|uniref:HD-GYP domain-containing protein n=1 Tax=Sporomusa sp. TaxID=2078658 RepID=UPI002B6A8881|nr:HD domain-containing phosphohydrolase [Sporomusa sp.]HWR07413.1 HD domain-containing phosphohydrolase [Sporomusa sp.]
MQKVASLLSLLGKHDPRTLSHSQSVAMQMFEWAACMDFSEQEMQKSLTCGMVHDIGKLCLSSTVLNKTEPLSEHEATLVNFHPLYGGAILNAMGLSEISQVIRYHRERYDGNGSPEGLKEAEIPFLSRMLAVCDAFDEMTNRRREHHRNLDTQQALRELERCAGTLFDPWLCRKFNSYMEIIETKKDEYLI